MAKKAGRPAALAGVEMVATTTLHPYRSIAPVTLEPAGTDPLLRAALGAVRFSLGVCILRASAYLWRGPDAGALLAALLFALGVAWLEKRAR